MGWPLGLARCQLFADARDHCCWHLRPLLRLATVRSTLSPFLLDPSGSPLVLILPLLMAGHS